MVEAMICAACGGPIIQLYSKYHPDFCSQECLRHGRTFCRYCHSLLSQTHNNNFKKVYCNDSCRRKYYISRTGPATSKNEARRSTCKGCGIPITQPKYGRRLFCSNKCNYQYYSRGGDKYSLTEEWGTYAPETRRILRELQSLKLDSTANRLASAIDREYKIRHKLKPEPYYVSCQCKTCGKEFRRLSESSLSRDYCSRKCDPVWVALAKEHDTRTLTWEQVDEIRTLYASKQFSMYNLAKRYDMTPGGIQRIVTYQRWKPENDPRKTMQSAD